MPYALPAMCLDISSAEAQLGQVHATVSVLALCSKGDGVSNTSRYESADEYIGCRYIQIWPDTM